MATQCFAPTSSVIFETIEIPNRNIEDGYESFLTPDAKRRDKFELQISRNHLRFGMPAYNFNWIDLPIPELDWSQGVVQIGHHSYNPAKDAGCPINQNAKTGCSPTTWHWDNVNIQPYNTLHHSARRPARG